MNYFPNTNSYIYILNKGALLKRREMIVKELLRFERELISIL